MTRRARRRRPALLLVLHSALLVVGLGAAGAGPAAAAALTAAGPIAPNATEGGNNSPGLAEPRVEDLTPWVVVAGEYAVRVRLPEGHPGGRLQARVFRMVDDGDEVRELDDPSRRYRWATYQVQVPEGASTVTLRIPLGEGEGERLYLDAGVYPVLLELFPHEGRTWEAVTYLSYLGEVPTPTPVALVVPVEAPLHWAPGTGVGVAPDDVARLGELAATLDAYPEVPVSLALEPALVTALGGTPTGSIVRDALAAIGRRGQVLQAPYADVAAGSWAGTGLDPDLVEQFAAGQSALTSFLGRSPDASTWLVDAGDSPPLLGWLAARNVTRFLLTPHVPGGSPAGSATPLRFEGIPTEHRAHAAAMLDAPLPATAQNPVLQANHLMAALAAEVLAGASAPRVVLAPGPSGGDLHTLASLLRALGEAGLFEPTTTAELPNSSPEAMAVPLPTPAAFDATTLLDDLARLHSRIQSFSATVGPSDPAVADLRRALLVAGRSSVDHAGRVRYLADVEALMRQSLSGIELADGGALTVTSHRARLPVTLRNTSSRSIEVAVAAESAELAMLGDPVRAVLAPGATEDVEIPFRVSRSGDFSVVVTVSTADGSFALTSREVTLRSTAVSGVGIVLSIGALAFLGLWWRRNRRRRRRVSPPSVVTTSAPAPDARVGEPVP